MADTVVFKNIAVNALEDNAGIFVGNNIASGWVSHSKTQGSIVQVIGFYNSFPHNINILHDNDVVDTYINDTDYHGPAALTQI